MSSLRPRVILARDGKVATRGVFRGPGEAPDVDNALSRLIKYIPAEVIALHQFLAGSGASQPKLAMWLSLLLLALTPIWFAVATREKDQPISWPQVVLSTFAFAIWLFAVGSPAISILPEALRLDTQAGSILFTFYMGITPLLDKLSVDPLRPAHISRY